MTLVVKAAVEELQGRRRSTAAHRAAAAAEPWAAVVVCAGWNCAEKELLAEAFLSQQLSGCTHWQPLLLVLSAHSGEKLPWQVVAPTLAQAPARLVQTNLEDFVPAQENMALFAPALARDFVDDNGCKDRFGDSLGSNSESEAM